MTELFVFDRNDSERKSILEISHDVVAYCSDEQLIAIECKSQNNFDECLMKAKEIDLSVMEKTIYGLRKRSEKIICIHL